MKKTFILLLLTILLTLSGCIQKEAPLPDNELTSSPSAIPTDAPAPNVQLEILNTDKLIQEDNGYTKSIKAYVEVKNTGDVTLQIKDSYFEIVSEGLLLSVINNISAYPEIIKPGEKSVIFFYNQHEAMLNFHGINTIVPHIRYEIVEDEPQFFPVMDERFYDYGEGEIYIIGRVENNTTEIVENAKIAYITRDEEGDVVHAGEAYIPFIKPGEKAPYQDISRIFGYREGDTKKLEVYAYKPKIEINKEMEYLIKTIIEESKESWYSK